MANEREAGFLMIRGSMKNVIVVKNTGSEVFEEAIFIVRPRVRSLSEKELRREARRIISAKTDIMLKKGFV